MENLRRVKLVSFDLDGTITDTLFADSVWLEGIPRLYADKNQISLEEAQSFLMSEYCKVGKGRLEWYDLGYWIRRLRLNVSPETVLSSFCDRIRIFPEVVGVLEELMDARFRLIVVTNARREFADLELEKAGLLRYFERVFSSTSDLGLVKNSAVVYEKVCNICGVRPCEIVHVGDDRLTDFQVPRKLGIISFHLDRANNCAGESVVHSLEELCQKMTSGRIDFDNEKTN